MCWTTQLIISIPEESWNIYEALCLMGVPSSKRSSNEALVLCREHTRHVKQAIDSRYALSAAHLSYIQSLRTVGTALRRFVEAKILITQ